MRPDPADRSLASDDDGYILVALLIAVAVASIWMAAALPSWRQQAIREKEAELIFRGEQYARAIYLYGAQVGRPGALPTSFDDLISQHVLRHKWKDPITGDEFLPKSTCGNPFGPGTPPPVGPSAPGAPGPRSGGARSSVIFPRPEVVLASMQLPPVGSGQAVQPQVPAPRGQGAGPASPFGGQGVVQGQGICGVQSKSHATSIRIYNGQQEYDLWQFDLGAATLQFSRNVAKVAGASGMVPGAVPATPVVPGVAPGGPGTGSRRGLGGGAQAPGGLGPGRGSGGTQSPVQPQIPPGGRGRGD
jgi:type II secretory pathway pseudopilin PulG